jgi:hypothetical protein
MTKCFKELCTTQVDLKWEPSDKKELRDSKCVHKVLQKILCGWDAFASLPEHEVQTIHPKKGSDKDSTLHDSIPENPHAGEPVSDCVMYLCADCFY